MDAAALLQGIHVVPVVVIEDQKQAVPLAEALCESGVRAMEITLRTECALSAIAAVADAVPELLVGAGSIRQPDQLRRAAEAGANFAVSPGSSDQLLRAARYWAMPFVPGAVTATEIIRLLEHGYRLQKFFPAELSGGLPQLRALAAPLPEVRFFPTGGIDAARAGEYLSFEHVACVGGSWFVPAAPLRSGDFGTVRRLTAEAVAAAEQVRGRSSSAV
jgi:2-dehydro-3-deoxyphosphogluconate aldolase/(4S)-4-hydroxy-2-oxoglutarate aldolase